MNNVAEILGQHKAEAIASSLRSKTLIEYLTYLVKESDFYRNGENNWAYGKVATFLEDGWQSQSQYTKIRYVNGLSLSDLGQAMNQVVGGTRFEKDRADEVGCSWTFEGSWPTRADVGAFLFFVTVESPA